MSVLNLKAAVFYTPEEVAVLFRHEGDLRWIYRNARPGRFLHPHARKINGKLLLFLRSGIDSMIEQSNT